MSAFLTYACVWVAVFCVAMSFANLYRLEPKRFLRLSIYGWASYALRYLILLISTIVGGSKALQSLADVCELWSAVFLMEGGCFFAGFRLPRQLRLAWLAISLAGIAADALGASLALTGILAHFLAGAMQISAGLVFLSRDRGRGAGTLTVGGTFILWGIHKIAFFWLSGPWDLAGRWISGLLALLVGGGMILAYLEDARRILQESEARFRALIEQAPDAIVVYDGDLRRLVDANAGAERLFGLGRGELLGSDPRRFDPGESDEPNDDDRDFHGIAERVLGGESLELERSVLRADGARLTCEVRLTRLPSEGHRLVRASYIDITERKGAEEASRRLNRELLAISRCNQVMVRAESEEKLLDDICRIICEEAGYRMAWVGYADNDDARTIRPVAWSGVEDGYLGQARLTWADTERGRGPAGRSIRSGKTAFIQDFSTDPQAAPWRDSALQRGYRALIALPLKDDNAANFGVLCIYSTEPKAFISDEIRLLEDLAGDLAFGIVALRALRERDRMAEQLRKQLLEKEVLLQEVHHRVKNNLQIVCSLINLQRNERGIASPIGRSLIDTETRVRAMSFVHEILYQSEDFASVGFSSYVSYLCAHLIETYAVDPHRVRLVASVEDIRLPLDKAIPCGLLINELVANALKHAFPNGRSGTIEIAMPRTEGNMVSLAVGDDGVGATRSELAEGKRASIGISLVKNLAAQLGGEYRSASSHGVVAKVLFPAGNETANGIP